MISFAYEIKQTQALGPIPRPVAEVSFQAVTGEWHGLRMVIDTGADLTLLPSYVAILLGYNLSKLEKIETQGVAGAHTVYLMREMKVKLGLFERVVPVGFIKDRHLPPLMGRHLFLDTFVTTLDKNKKVTFLG